MKNNMISMGDEDGKRFREFILDFFKDSEIEEKEGIVKVIKTAVDFEEFIGKKAPYLFVFSLGMHKKVKDSELIIQGSYFLHAIRDYLDNKGQTCISKILIAPQKLKLDLSKSKKIKLEDINEIRIIDNGFICQWTFLSKFQYLNEKKESIIKIFTKEGESINFDLSKYKMVSGNFNDIKSIDVTSQYIIAKKMISKLGINEIKSIKKVLKEKQEKEINRLKAHYLKQINEKDDELKACENKIKMLNSKLRHTSYDRDIRIIKRIIRESEERLEMLKKKGYKERLKEEEIFHINDAVDKHALLIKNKIINLKIIYYPIFEIKIVRKGKTQVIRYDSLFDN